MHRALARRLHHRYREMGKHSRYLRGEGCSERVSGQSAAQDCGRPFWRTDKKEDRRMKYMRTLGRQVGYSRFPGSIHLQEHGS